MASDLDFGGNYSRLPSLIRLRVIEMAPRARVNRWRGTLCSSRLHMVWTFGTVFLEKMLNRMSFVRTSHDVLFVCRENAEEIQGL